MKSVFLHLIIVCVLMVSCTSEKTIKQKLPDQDSGIHTSQNSLDWIGTYSGTLPCASCPGIETTLSLRENGTYEIQKIYLWVDEPEPFESSGSFSWNEVGNTVTLEEEEIPNQYFVGENYVTKLDSNGERITGELAELYILRKNIK